MGSQKWLQSAINAFRVYNLSKIGLKMYNYETYSWLVSNF